MAAIVQTLGEIDDDDDEDEDDGKIELPPDKLVWIGCAVSGLMAVFTATVALCTVNEATKSRYACRSLKLLKRSLSIQTYSVLHIAYIFTCSMK